MTVALVVRRHGRNLETLHIFKIAIKMSCFEPSFSALNEFGYGDLKPSAFEALGSRTVAHNRKSLSHLRLAAKEILPYRNQMNGNHWIGEASYFIRRLVGVIQVRLLHATGRDL